MFDPACGDCARPAVVSLDSTSAPDDCAYSNAARLETPRKSGTMAPLPTSSTTVALARATAGFASGSAGGAERTVAVATVGPASFGFLASSAAGCWAVVEAAFAGAALFEGISVGTVSSAR